MTVETNLTIIRQTGSGTVTDFTGPQVLDPQHVVVKFVRPDPTSPVGGPQRLSYTPLVYGTDYEVLGFQEEEQCTVRILNSAFIPDNTAGTSLIIYRNTPLQQPVQLPNTRTVPGELVERNFDRFILILQEMAERLRKTIRFSEDEITPDPLLKGPPDRAFTILGFDVSGALFYYTGQKMAEFVANNIKNLGKGAGVFAGFVNGNIQFRSIVVGDPGALEVTTNSNDEIIIRQRTVSSGNNGILTKEQWARLLQAEAAAYEGRTVARGLAPRVAALESKVNLLSVSFIGVYSTPPTVGPGGMPLTLGMTYFNSVDLDLFVWVNEWIPLGVSNAVGLTTLIHHYEYTFPGGSPVSTISGVDLLGNTLKIYSPRAELVAVYLEGIRVPSNEFTVNPISNTITFVEPVDFAPVGATFRVIVEVLSDSSSLSPVTVGIQRLQDFSSLFDGELKSFDLISVESGTAVMPEAPEQIFVVLDGVVQQARVDYEVTGSIIEFTQAPRADSIFFGLYFRKTASGEGGGGGGTPIENVGVGAPIYAGVSGGLGQLRSLRSITPALQVGTTTTEITFGVQDATPSQSGLMPGTYRTYLDELPITLANILERLNAVEGGPGTGGVSYGSEGTIVIGSLAFNHYEAEGLISNVIVAPPNIFGLTVPQSYGQA